MSEVFLGVPDPHIFSYSRFYFYWKKRAGIASLFAQEIRRHKGAIRVLEAGCGSGFDLFYLNSLYNDGGNCLFTGVDLSPENISAANSAKDTKKITTIDFQVGNVEKLQFAEDTFDIVICSELLEHLPEPVKGIAEIKRVLKNDGILIMTTPNKSNYFLKAANIFRFFNPRKEKADMVIDKQKAPFGKGFGHISVKNRSEWLEIFRWYKFKIATVKRGACIYAGFDYDYLRIPFALMIILDTLLDYLPGTGNFTETVILKLRNKKIE